MDNEQITLIDDYYAICYNCDCFIESSDDSTYVWIEDTEQIVCLSCSLNYFTCNQCDSLYEESEGVYGDDGNFYCNGCYEEIRDSHIPDYEFNGNSDWWRDE